MDEDSAELLRIQVDKRRIVLDAGGSQNPPVVQRVILRGWSASELPLGEQSEDAGGLVND